MMPLYVSTDDVSWAMFSRPFWSDFNEALRKSNVFHDAPWFVQKVHVHFGGGGGEIIRQ